MTQKKVTLLLVDDEKMNTMILSRRLRKEGFDIDEAGDGQQAVASVLNKHKPDLILMDLMMPVMDGWEATKQIKQKFPDVKIIAVSAKVDEEFHTIEQGFDGFCAKPINFKVLIKKIEQVLNLDSAA
ncbi:response regulator [Pseudobacteriovorax antillogorgiicola]|uniref:CheY chemotaxis protein or a CheY-like REC (Receiver) domain n=1 Tax=Pseudobacteriovorax antillogorgiicola TaxID=1513793 RepID=A0A1Y6CUT3_9BACT|nr:response regulator [Pseudobacteriovorax antillogorgiicola]TCS45017.1 CheY-like chemotaxis protein [Pseudobacteriovorax antillogorgiicola]SMF76352.1 CheY chemotaxis protein or a CheY-like REC (receiver) domain [Pseudobacteriovorax antillogorgiicola]